MYGTEPGGQNNAFYSQPKGGRSDLGTTWILRVFRRARAVQELQARESNEQRWLVTYKKISEEANELLIRFLLNLIIIDEERDGKLIDRLVSSLKDDLVSTPQEMAGQAERARKRKSSALPPN